MEQRIERLKACMGGWPGYFALADTPSVFEDIEGWLRRRLRMCLWKQWKRVRTRYHELRALGPPDWVVSQFANSRKTAHGPMSSALDIPYVDARGLMSLTARYRSIRQA